jgi:AraC-like DNA-binding protein
MNLNASAALSTLCIGESSVIRSSADLSWSGFLLERQLANANMRINDHADQNMLALVSSQVMRGEHQTKSGTTLVRKTAGVAEFAVACGFSSQAHLTLAFRKQTGLTPAEYRRSQ